MSSALERFHLRHVGWLLASLALVAAPHWRRTVTPITVGTDAGRGGNAGGTPAAAAERLAFRSLCR